MSRYSLHGGLLALVCWLPSLLTEDASSSLKFGRIFCICSALSLLIPCHTIHEPMVWLRECIGSFVQSKAHYIILVYSASYHPLGNVCFLCQNGIILRLPGDFFDQTPQIKSPCTLADQLWQYMVLLRPSPVLIHGQRPFLVTDNLQFAIHVFVRHDAHQTPLQ